MASAERQAGGTPPPPSEPDRIERDDGAGFSETGALVASGATVMRIENEQMMAVSVQRPRDEDAVKKAALAELSRYPEVASECFYVLPFRDDSDNPKPVKGLSIEAALALARYWRNNTSKVFVVGEDEDKVHLSGIYMDLETNVRIERPLTVSKWLRRRNGVMEHLSDRKLIQAIQAGVSKALRNAILSGLPEGLKATYFAAAQQIAGTRGHERWKLMVQRFNVFGVTEEMLETYLGHAVEEVTAEEIGQLSGIYNAIRDGQIAAAEAFGGDRQGTDAPSEEESTRTVEAALAGGARETDTPEQGWGTHPPEPKPEAKVAQASPREGGPGEAELPLGGTEEPPPPTDEDLGF